jgi:hypothetical protein
MNQVLSKQMKSIELQEERFLNPKENVLFKEKVAPVLDKIQDKIPEKLESTLETAFFKGFQLVFEKGNTYIEKTYNKEQKLLDYDVNNYAVDRKLCNRFISKLDRSSLYSNAINSSVSIVEGGLLGMLGIGLPDIPLFIALLMKTVYEVSLSYGHDYETDETKGYILLLIRSALTKGDLQKTLNEQTDKLGYQLDHKESVTVNLEEEMQLTSKALSDALLTAKFIQGIPVVGAVGGLVNYNIVQKVSQYSKIKFKKRYLLKKAEASSDVE